MGMRSVPTALLSNTPHYPTLAGAPLPAQEVAALLQQIPLRVRPSDIAAVVTGWMGSAETVEAAAEFITALKAEHSDLIYLCDPVMGDEIHGLYVAPDCAAAIADHLAPLADILTPNGFELARLHRDRLRAEALILETSVETAPDRLGVRIAGGSEMLQADGPRLPLTPTGTGDVFASAFLAERLDGVAVDAAMRRGVGLVQGLIEAAIGMGRAELPLAARLPDLLAQIRR
jgi:pyridoxine kinase